MTSRVVDPRVTEQRNPRTQQIDLADPLGIVDIMRAEDEGVPVAVASQRDALLQLFVVDKALYELNYELNNRPDWVRIPLYGIVDLLGSSDRGQVNERLGIPT